MTLFVFLILHVLNPFFELWRSSTMRNSDTSVLLFSRCKACIFFLCAFCLGGLLFGSFLAVRLPESNFSWMHAVPLHRASIVGMLTASLLPFLLTACAVSFSLNWAVIPLAFCKTSLFSLFSVLTILSYGGCGWLVRLLLLFSDIVSLPILMWLWIRILQGKCGSSFRTILVCAAAGMAVTVFDYLVISPYLAYLIS